MKDLTPTIPKMKDLTPTIQPEPTIMEVAQAGLAALKRQ
jgi:hypothetical protein